jgi:hypothetical protein
VFRSHAACGSAGVRTSPSNDYTVRSSPRCPEFYRSTFERKRYHPSHRTAFFMVISCFLHIAVGIVLMYKDFELNSASLLKVCSFCPWLAKGSMPGTQNEKRLMSSDILDWSSECTTCFTFHKPNIWIWCVRLSTLWRFLYTLHADIFQIEWVIFPTAGAHHSSNLRTSTMSKSTTDIREGELPIIFHSSCNTIAV